ncbi:hypothetical protein KCMC57_64660 (plasmid) [Kitasatospora sp. CMC57]|uniref:Uncharacterized protein n=1 Tax=Kitasatospora sp. CMC57 TaxID=3231513 RepID=A0AB33K4G7_9ACTN
MTLALADPDTAADFTVRLVRPTARTIEHHQLTTDQARHLDEVLTLLGTADGLIEDEPQTTDPGFRQYLSTAIAAEVGITITPGHEIAQCNTCSLVMDGELALLDGGRIRCTHCRADWQDTLDEGPDTTRDTW